MGGPPGGAPLGQQQQQQRARYDHVVPCNSRHLSCTMRCIPNSLALQNRCQVPMGLMLQPLAETGDELPVVSFSKEVVRCNQCRAYINPYSEFRQGGSIWTCNLCSTNNKRVQSCVRKLLGLVRKSCRRRLCWVRCHR